MSKVLSEKLFKKLEKELKKVRRDKIRALDKIFDIKKEAK